MQNDLTEQDFSFLAQLVYFDPLRKDGTPWPSKGQAHLTYTVKELLDSYRRLLDTPDDPLKPAKSTGVDAWVYADQVHFLTDPKNEAYQNWIITDICAHNTSIESGLYGFTVHIDADTSAVVFRGSENPKEHLNDWRASLDIANNMLIAQHREASDYIEQRADVLGQPGHTLYFVGHSLGGHVAQFCTFLAADTVRANIRKCVTFNSPGFNLAFLKKHAARIDEQKSKITNYQNQNDFVSSLLTSPVPPIILHSQYNQFNFFCNHAISSCRLDKNGHFIVARVQQKSFICGGVYSWSLGIQQWSRERQERAKWFWVSLFQGDPLYIKAYSSQMFLLFKNGVGAMTASLF
ncbi:MAG: Mbeg1-like protein [Ethanoligenens sp.]|uniref:Mbeg1-like protein n=1 Tax=Ethanoligenens sp. TaxID=2099655 RepID=UPI0039EA3E08